MTFITFLLTQTCGMFGKAVMILLRTNLRLLKMEKYGYSFIKLFSPQPPNTQLTMICLLTHQKLVKWNQVL